MLVGRLMIAAHWMSRAPEVCLPENGQNTIYNADSYEADSEADDPMESLRQMIAELEPDSLTPKQALSVLYDLKSALPEDEG